MQNDLPGFFKGKESPYGPMVGRYCRDIETGNWLVSDERVIDGGKEYYWRLATPKEIERVEDYLAMWVY